MRRDRTAHPATSGCGENSTPYLGQSSSSARVCPAVMRPVRMTKLRMGRLRSSFIQASRDSIDREEGARGIIQCCLPVCGGIAVGAVGDVLHAGEARVLCEAHARERERLHIDHITCDFVTMRGERVRGRTQHLRKLCEDARELDHGRCRVEGRHARRQAHPAHIHVPLREAIGRRPACGRQSTGCRPFPCSPPAAERRPYSASRPACGRGRPRHSPCPRLYIRVARRRLRAGRGTPAATP